MKISKKILPYLVAFFVCIFIFISSLTLVNLIPKSAIEKNLTLSSETLMGEKEKNPIQLSYKRELLFYYSDVTMLNIIASTDSHTPFTSAILARRNYLPEQNQELNTIPTATIPANEAYLEPDFNCLIREFYGMMHGDELPISWEYARYWHGYQVFLRPLLCIFDLAQIRVFLFVCMFVLFFWFLILCTKKLGIFPSICFALGLLSATIFVITKSINESLLFLFTLVTMILLLSCYEKMKKPALFFFVIGAMVSYFDLLTSPLVSVIFPVTILLLCEIKLGKRDVKMILKDYFKCIIAWGIAYALIWISKWIIIDLLFQRGIFRQSIEQASMRSISEDVSIALIFQRVDILISHPTYFATLVTAVFLGAIGLILHRKDQISYRKIFQNAFPFILNCFLPFAWCLVVKNHAVLHPFFTYRLFSITIANLLLLVLLFTGLFSISDTEPKKLLDQNPKKIFQKKKQEN